MITAVLNSRRHPQQAYRSCLGLLRLAKCHGDARLEAAATRALAIGSYSYRSVESILKHRLDETSEQFERTDPVEHDNIRNADILVMPRGPPIAVTPRTSYKAISA